MEGSKNLSHPGWWENVHFPTTSRRGGGECIFRTHQGEEGRSVTVGVCKPSRFLVILK